MEAATDAVSHWRALGEVGGVEPDLAGALNNLSIGARKNQSHRGGSGGPLEATSLFRMQATDDRRRFAPSLALALSNLSRSLTSTDRRPEAALALEEAIEIRRLMAAAEAGRGFAVDLASSLNNLSFLLFTLGREEMAIATGREAVERYRELAAAEPELFVPDLARTLSNMALLLEYLGEHDQAADLIEETLADFDNSPLQGVLELARGVWLMGNDDIHGAVLSGRRALGALEGLQGRSHAAQARGFLQSLARARRRGLRRRLARSHRRP